MRATPNLNFSVVEPTKKSLEIFVTMLRSVYQNLVNVINGNLGFGDGTNSDNINGVWINVVAPVAPNTDFTLTHNLNRLPVGYWAMTKDRACDVYTGSIPATKTQLTLRATVASAVLRLFVVGLLFGLLASRSEAQGASHQNFAAVAVNTAAGSGILKVIPSAVITVCNGAVLPPAGSTCSGTALIFADNALSLPLSNPFNADLRGNYTFFAKAGQNYVVSVGGVGVATQSYVWIAPVVSGGFSTTLTTGALISTSPNPALSGFIRMASSIDCLVWRDNFNLLDLTFCKDSSDRLTFRGSFIPIVVYSTPSISTNATIAGVTLSPGSGTNGNTYRASFYVDQTVAGTGCSTNTTIVLSVAYTDPSAVGATSQTVGTTITLVNNGSVGSVLTAGNVAGSWSYLLRSKASTVVQYSAVYSVGTCTTGPSYQVYPILEQLN